MKKKNIIIIFAILCILISFVVLFYKNYKKESYVNVNVSKQAEPIKQIDSNKNINTNNTSDTENYSKKITQSISVEINNTNLKNTKMYKSDASANVPLSTITIISDLPKNIQDKVANIIDSNNIFMTKKINDKLLIITDNPENIRHCVEFTEISLNNGHQVKTTLGLNDKIKDSDNDIWEYDKNTGLPVRHSMYNSEGDIEYVETWDYGNAPIKYELKDANNHVISMRKETLENGTDLRIEHLIYDKAGNTKINVSTSYNGSDLVRFTYYNADKPSDGGSVFSEYTDGLKTKEIVYSNDLKVLNTYTSDYKDGERKDIVIWDKNNKEVLKYTSDDSDEKL